MRLDGIVRIITTVKTFSFLGRSAFPPPKWRVCLLEGAELWGVLQVPQLAALGAQLSDQPVMVRVASLHDQGRVVTHLTQVLQGLQCYPSVSVLHVLHVHRRNNSQNGQFFYCNRVNGSHIFRFYKLRFLMNGYSKK